MMMNDRTWEKLAALGGVAFVVLNIVGSILQGAPPASGDTNEEVLDWFVDNDAGIKVSVLLGALSMIALIWWFGSLWRRMSAAEDGNHRLSVVALIGLGGSGAMFAVHAAILSAVAINVDDVSADAARFYFVMSSTVLSMGGAFLVAHLAAVNALAIRTDLLPKWLTGVGLVSAALFLVASLGTMTDSDPVMLFGFLGFIAWLVWILGTSAQIWRTADALAD